MKFITKRSFNEPIKFIIAIVAILCCTISAIAQQNISPKSVNLETIDKAEPISLEFRLTNNSEEPVSIISVTVSTAKLKVHYSKTPIPPKGVGIISLTVDTQDLSTGDFKKKIRVKTTGKPSYHTISLTGTVSDIIPERQTRNEGISWVRIYVNSKYGAEINSTTIIPPLYDKLLYNEALQCFIGLNNNKLELLSLSGKKIASSDFTEYSIDRQGILIKNASYMSYINKFGNNTIPFSAGYKKLFHHIVDQIGEYFSFEKENMYGILDQYGNVKFELPALSDEHRMIIPYYIDNILLYVSNDGIYDQNKQKLCSFTRVAHTPLDMAFIEENGDIVVFEPTEEDIFATRKIGSIYNLSYKRSENPYK